MTDPVFTRVRYYNPVLDPRTQREKMTPAMREAAQDGRYNDGTTAGGGPLLEPDEAHPYNLVSSLCDDGMHRPALDIDMDCRLVPSSTPGHWHLFLDGLALDWDRYVRLLEALAEAGVIEPGYLAASRNRGQTLLRPSHVRKWSLRPSTSTYGDEAF